MVKKCKVCEKKIKDTEDLCNECSKFLKLRYSCVDIDEVLEEYSRELEKDKFYKKSRRNKK